MQAGAELVDAGPGSGAPVATARPNSIIVRAKNVNAAASRKTNRAMLMRASALV